MNEFLMHSHCKVTKIHLMDCPCVSVCRPQVITREQVNGCHALISCRDFYFSLLMNSNSG